MVLRDVLRPDVLRQAVASRAAASRWVIAFAALFVSACAGKDAPPAPGGNGEGDAAAPTTPTGAATTDDGLPPIDMTGPIGGARPAEVKTPDDYDPAEKDPAKK